MLGPKRSEKQETANNLTTEQELKRLLLVSLGVDKPATSIWQVSSVNSSDGQLVLIYERQAYLPQGDTFLPLGSVEPNI